MTNESSNPSIDVNGERIEPMAISMGYCEGGISISFDVPANEKFLKLANEWLEQKTIVKLGVNNLGKANANFILNKFEKGVIGNEFILHLYFTSLS